MDKISNKYMTRLQALFQSLPIDVVYLYGSKSTGKADKLSDSDFSVLFSQKLSDKRRFDLRLSLFGEIAKRLHENEDNIDVVDLEEVPLLLQFNIISGKIIYNRNETRRVMFEAYVMSRYHDEHYYLDRYLTATLAKIKKGVYFERTISYT